MLSDLLVIMDLTGVAVFAATGGLVASRKQMDLIGFGMMATLTGIGGGTLRDALLDRPIFWITDQRYLLVCLGIALIIYFFAPLVQRRYTLLLWGDAIGLAAFSVLGAFIALQTGATPLPAIVLGMMTATFGGLIRDIVAGEKSLLLKPEVYATAALLSAGVFTVMASFGVPLILSTLTGIVAGFALRAGGIHFGWSLPRYRQRAGRTYK
ncbi:MAG: trimeric intracellular cation channel family protein [Proteobacteria bacterium]|nr:trimeric intracellular cation channel family protein [Pseudomonadota bacterium]